MHSYTGKLSRYGCAPFSCGSCKLLAEFVCQMRITALCQITKDQSAQ